ncbi:MAG: hypothetical protein LAP21_23985 [Acidobacteriia bacterium]|nr:hypothetical protein [Terriglobia bacterium]
MQCSKRKRDGSKCRAKAGPSGRCALHSGRNKAKELAAKSVEVRKQAAVEVADRLAVDPPETAQALLKELATAFAEVKGGDLDVNRAKALSSLGNTLWRGFEFADMKTKLSELEELIRTKL